MIEHRSQPHDAAVTIGNAVSRSVLKRVNQASNEPPVPRKARVTGVDDRWNSAALACSAHANQLEISNVVCHKRAPSRDGVLEDELVVSAAQQRIRSHRCTIDAPAGELLGDARLEHLIEQKPGGTTIRRRGDSAPGSSAAPRLPRLPLHAR